MEQNLKFQKSAEKIDYEINMINELGNCYKQFGSKEINDAILESFLLHVRNIYNFLTKKKDNKKYLDRDGQPKEVLAIHYFENDSKWKNKIERIFRYCKENYSSKNEQLTQINDHLAHITYSRIHEKIKWDCESILNDVKNAWETFLDELDSDRRKWFNSKIIIGAESSPGMTGRGSKNYKTSQSYSKTKNEDIQNPW